MYAFDGNVLSMYCETISYLIVLLNTNSYYFESKTRSTFLQGSRFSDCLRTIDRIKPFLQKELLSAVN